MRNLIALALLALALPLQAQQQPPPSSAQAAGQAIYGAASSIAQPIAKATTDLASSLVAPIVASSQARTDLMLLNIQYLSPRKMKAIEEPRCIVYFDLVTAAHRATYATPAAKVAGREAALQKAWDAKCIEAKTPWENLDASLRIFFQERRLRLVNSPACAVYGTKADEMIVSNFTDEQKRSWLTQMFVVAQENSCYLTKP